MGGHQGSGAGWLGWTPRVVLVCLLTAGCGEGPPADEVQEPVEQVAAAVEDTLSPAPGLRPFLPDDMQRSTRAETFPHDSHGQIDCAVCHQVPRGHGSHDEVTCADCHRASANATLAALTPEQCQACHHGVEQSLNCEVCHESRPTLASVQELNMEVWDAPRTRSLAFDHGLHADLTCASCHRALPALSPAESCASCHADHHTVEVRCAECHVPPAEDAHDVQSHLTCSGSGCHRTPEVEAIASTRPVCLSCHLEQEEHELEGDCIQCHRVRGEPTAWRLQ